MLTIRKDQLKAFGDQKLLAFAEEMVLHIREFSPIQFKVTGEENVRKIILTGIDRAITYGFTYRGSMQFYLEMMFMLGSDFDTDPQYPWVRKILINSSEADQEDRSSRLFDEVIDFLDNVAGNDFLYERNALSRIIDIPFDDWEKINFEEPVKFFKELEKIYPEKAAKIDAADLYELYHHAAGTARKYMISGHGGTALSFILMVAFGHGCFTDLQYPWILSTIREGSNLEFQDRTKLLFEKMITYFASALKNLSYTD